MHRQNITSNHKQLKIRQDEANMSYVTQEITDAMVEGDSKWFLNNNKKNK